MQESTIIGRYNCPVRYTEKNIPSIKASFRRARNCSRNRAREDEIIISDGENIRGLPLDQLEGMAGVLGLRKRPAKRVELFLHTEYGGEEQWEFI